MVLGRTYQPLQRHPMDLACHHLGTMKRKDDKGDQPSGGETTWTNIGATRYGRGQHKAISFAGSHGFAHTRFEPNPTT